MDLNNYTIEELANALYLKCEERGLEKGTDKTKWREAVVADKLGFTVHKKISAGAASEDYGSDARDQQGQAAEFKSKALSDKDLRNLFQLKRGKTTYSPLEVTGVYNGFNSNYEHASVAYAQVDHYFALFYKEKCVLVVKVDRDHVMTSLTSNYEKWVAGGRKGSSNLNSVKVRLDGNSTYSVAYKDEEFFKQQ